MPGFDWSHPLDSLWGMMFGGGSDEQQPPISVPPPAVDPRNQPTPAEVAPAVAHWADPGNETATVHKPAPRAPGEKESVVYLGVNDASRETEKKAFAGMSNATVLTGAGTNKEMQGKTMSTDGKTVLDLANEEDVHRFLRETGVGGVRTGEDGKAQESPEQAKARMIAMEEIFLGKKNENGQRTDAGLNVGVRDEMAQYVQTMQKVETGQMSMDRMIISGHSTGAWAYSEAEGNPGVTYDQIAQINKQFGGAAGGVQDLMFSACHTLEKGAQDGDTSAGSQYLDMFPHLQSVWGYNGFSPTYAQGSPAHMRAFMNASQGNDPNKVVAAAKATGQNATARNLQ